VRNEWKVAICQFKSIGTNEHPLALEKAAVIDLYDLINAQYLLGFYLFNFNRNERLKGSAGI